MSDTGTKTKNAEQVQDTPLTIREHLDPDKHWIGEALAPPTQGEIEATIGSSSGPGESPFVARADHKHKLGSGVVGVDNITSGIPTKAYVDSKTMLLRSRFSRGDTAYAASTVFTLAYSVNSEVSGPSGVNISQSSGIITVPVTGTYSLSLFLNPTGAWGATNTAGGSVQRNDIGSHYLNSQTLMNTSVGVLLSWVGYLIANDTLNFSFSNNSASSVTMAHYAEVALITPDVR